MAKKKAWKEIKKPSTRQLHELMKSPDDLLRIPGYTFVRVKK